MSARKWCRECSIAAPRAHAIVRVVLDDFSPETGIPVVAGDKPVGTMGSTAGGKGLALLRVDRVADALDAGLALTAGGLALHLADPNDVGPAEANRRDEQASVMSRSARQHPDGKTRCPWPGEDPFYMAYHDTEWGVPEYDDRALYEKLILDGFQAGLSWITILRKRDNFRKAFRRFPAGEDRALQREESPRADERCRHRAQPLQDRRRRQQRQGLSEDHGRRPGLLPVSVGFRRRQAES